MLENPRRLCSEPAQILLRTRADFRSNLRRLCSESAQTLGQTRADFESNLRGFLKRQNQPLSAACRTVFSITVSFPMTSGTNPDTLHCPLYLGIYRLHFDLRDPLACIYQG
ncbi:hypothetical protein [Reichenbachiella sp. MSK19-1]|uniref:hypothetical protein n=1 Tax=Reichenbachiella sp. MSK19-1 TaxID=1897631 RepID=UPI0011C40716|nr:hypothetical protein [Reichenbachiella sp. MSK19-1]